MAATGSVGRARSAKGALALGISAASLLALLNVAAAGTGAARLGPEGTPAPMVRGRALAAYGKLPLGFVANAGQLDARVRYQAQVADASFAFTRTEAVFTFARERKGHVLRLRFVGADPGVEIVGTRLRPGTVNYLIGGDPAAWRTEVPTYGEVVYRGLWPGIDLAFRGDRGTLKYEFRVAAGADPSRIRLAYRGADSVRLDSSGNLLVGTSLGTLSDTRPVSYQQGGGSRVPVDSRYTVSGASYGFALGSYDRARPLVVDPGLVYSTYLGGNQYDVGNAVTVDADGSAYVVGTTGVNFLTVNNFPTTAGAFDTTFNGSEDVFVAKLNPAGSGLVYSTFLGGGQFDLGHGIAVDAAGNAYVTGRTGSTNFPTTAGAFDSTLGGLADAFVTKLDPTGSALLYSTYLGGNGVDGAEGGVAVDGDGRAYVTGVTQSADFPTTVGAFDRVLNGLDAFVAKLDTTGTALSYSTFLGGTGAEQGKGIALDTAGDAYVTGLTNSTNFPTTAGAFDVTLNGADDVFVTKLNPVGSALAYSTYLGGSSQDIGWGIAADDSGGVYVTGHTNSANFPVTSGAFDGALTGLQDAFVAKLAPSGSALVYSTYLGGSSGNFAEAGLGVGVDGEGSAIVTGSSGATDFPTTPDAVATSNSGVQTVFVTKLDAIGSAIQYSTFIPGADASTDRPGSGGIVVDATGAAYVTGIAVGLLTTPGAYDTSHAGSGDAFVTKLDTGSPPVPTTVTLTPPTDTNPVGTSHSVTAEVLDAEGETMEGILVRFDVTGSVTASGECTTGAEGTCSFSYQGPDYPGADLIVAFADTDEDGVRGEDEPAGEATKSWVLPDSTPGRASGGGNIDVDGSRIAFGFSAAGADRTRASCRVIDRAADVVVECTDVSAFVIVDNTVTVYGSALVNGIPTTFRIDAADNARRGRGADTFSIQTGSGYSRSGLLVGGNVRVD